MFKHPIVFRTSIAAFMIIASTGEAAAAVCANGVYRAGCVGPNGAVGVRKGYVAPRAVVVARRPMVVAPAPVIVARRPVVVAPVRCAWINGRRVCR